MILECEQGTVFQSGANQFGLQPDSLGGCPITRQLENNHFFCPPPILFNTCFIFPSIHQFIFLFNNCFVFPSIHQFIFLFNNCFIFPPIHQFIFLFNNCFVFPSIHQFIFLFNKCFVFPSIHQFCSILVTTAHFEL